MHRMATYMSLTPSLWPDGSIVFAYSCCLLMSTLIVVVQVCSVDDVSAPVILLGADVAFHLFCPLRFVDDVVVSCQALCSMNSKKRMMSMPNSMSISHADGEVITVIEYAEDEGLECQNELEEDVARCPRSHLSFKTMMMLLRKLSCKMPRKRWSVIMCTKKMRL